VRRPSRSSAATTSCGGSWRSTTRPSPRFEILFVGVYLTDGDRIQRYEFFDVADADRALARFEELCSDRP